MVHLEEAPERSPRFDEFLELGADELAATVGWLTPILDECRKRARKPGEVDDFNRTVGLVVANALMGGPQGVHYSRRFVTYSGNSIYKPAWLGSKRLLGVIGGMGEASLLELFPGRWINDSGEARVESSFRAAHRLMAELEAREITLRSVRRDVQSAPVIVLKDKDRNRVQYDPRDEWVFQRSEELRAYNVFVGRQHISRRAGADTPRFCALTRIFNHGRWDRGGRHFNGWWQHIPSAQRADILINERETIELDFGGFNTRAVYHRSGQQPDGDPYDVPKVRRLFEDRGLDCQAEARPIVKKVLNIAIAAKRRSALRQMDDQIVPLGIDPDELVELVLEHHSAIRPYLFRGLALEAMNLESAVCNDVILKGMSDNITILPIFDSFITDTSHKDYLMDQMSSAYQARTGHLPVIH